MKTTVYKHGHGHGQDHGHGHTQGHGHTHGHGHRHGHTHVHSHIQGPSHIHGHGYQASVVASGRATQYIRLQKEIAAYDAIVADNFVAEFEVNPYALCAKLEQLIRTDFHKFYYQHPRWMPDVTRIVLNSVNKKMVQIQPNSGTKESFREYYKQLVIMLNNIHYSVHDRDYEFATIVKQLLCYAHTKPDHMLESSYFGLQDLDLYEEEERSYNTLISSLEKYQNESFKWSIISKALTAITHEMQIERNLYGRPDYHFYNIILTNIEKLAQNPHNEDAVKILHMMSAHAAGHASRSREVAGVMCIAAGIVMVAAILPSIMIPAISVPLVCAAIAVAIATFSMGCYLCKSGAQQGLALVIDEVTEELSDSVTMKFAMCG